jgi:cytochrome c biogenesis protein CcdA
MKKIFIGIGKAILFIVALLMTAWILNGFNVLSDDMKAIQLAVGIILLVFIEREQSKRLWQEKNY